jgi:translation initiation factor 3 subunit F
MSVDHTLFVQSSQQVYQAKAYLVKVHPLVLFNIVDHYSRRGDGLPRVVGTLLGQYNDGIVNISNSYAVVHVERPKLLFGTPSNQAMYKMHKAVNPSEVMLGWYATTIDVASLPEAEADDEREINMHSVALHQRYNEEIKNESTFRQTVHLVVDTSLEGNKLAVKAYVASPVPLGAFGERCYVFKQIEVEVAASPAERFAIHTIAQSTAVTNSHEFADVAPLATDVDFLQTALLKLLGLIEQALAYVNKVVDGSQEGDGNIGFLISTALSSIPRIDTEAYHKTFTSSEKDIRMVQNLIMLVEEQLKIASPLLVV